METLQFSVVKRNVQPVVLEQENGQQDQYEIRELTVADREKYMTSMAQRMRYTADGKPAGVKDFSGSYAELLTRCMFKKNPSSNEWAPVKKDEVEKWPAAAAYQIFEAAQRINKIETGAQEKEDAKND